MSTSIAHPVPPALNASPVDAVLREAVLAAARKQVTIGAVMFLVGLALLFTGFPVVFIGAIIFGPVRVVRGLTLMSRVASVPPGSPLPADLFVGKKDRH